jgi:hypothetical protein
MNIAMQIRNEASVIISVKNTVGRKKEGRR